MTDLKKLPLDSLHRELGGKMVPFAGYDMPVQYAPGVKAEHLHVRAKAGLFDVSHMGQAWLTVREGAGTLEAHKAVAEAIERVVPGEIQKLPKGKIRYTVLLDEAGGLLDDLMISRPAGEAEQGSLFLVVNAAVKAEDFAVIGEATSDVADLTVLEGRALLALQGPEAAAVLSQIIPEAATLPFMAMMDAEFDGLPIMVSRCGYTGEDGYELSVPAEEAERVAKRLLEFDEVEPIGLGARDSLRLEAGLCLSGQDFTTENSPVEAGISFSIGKRRRAEGGFRGFDRISGELGAGPARQLVGLKPSGRAPARAGTEIQTPDGETVGAVTSGGFGPTVDGPISIGYVASGHAAPGTTLNLIVRGKPMAAEVVALPFVEKRFYRGA